MKKLRILIIALFIIIGGCCCDIFDCKDNDDGVLNTTPDTTWYRGGVEYILTTTDQLAGLAYLVANGHSMAGKTFRLGTNISLKPENRNAGWNYLWLPIGDSDKNPFKGNFDGNGYVISGLYLSSKSDHNGLFGYVDGGYIRNLGLSDVYVNGRNNTGGLVGTIRQGSYISNCFVSGIVIGNHYTGGFIGHNEGGTVDNCYSTAAVSGSSLQTGGFAGLSTGIYSSIRNCYYNTETSGQSDTGKGHPKTTEEMKQQTTYIGWDFTNIWAIYDNYPYLQN